MNNRIEYKNEDGERIIFTASTRFFLTDFPLLSGLPVALNTSQSIDQIGGTVESQLIDPRTVTIKGFISQDGTEGKKQLVQIIRPLSKGTFTLNDEYSMDVVVSDAPTISRARMFPEFSFGVTAPYPFWQKTQESITPVSGAIGRFSFPWCIAEPYSFGIVVTSFFSTVTNNGQIPTYYDLEINASGDASVPTFTDVQTGKFLKINKSFVTNEKVIVSIRPDGVSAVSSVDGDIQGLIDIQSTLFSFPPGDTILKYDAEQNRENLTIQLRLSDKFAGVVL